MKDRWQALLKSRATWALIGTVAGAVYPPVGQAVSLLSNVLLGG